MYQNYVSVVDAITKLGSRLSQVSVSRDNLVQSFDRQLGVLRLPMRLRRRSGGMLAWRNVSVNPAQQRDHDLMHYEQKLIQLPQSVQDKLMQFEQHRILVNLNLSLVQHEKKQLTSAASKIVENRDRQQKFSDDNLAVSKLS